MRFALSPKKRAYLKGHWGEWVAANYLRLKGYVVLERRLKTPVGEIDLLVAKGNALVAVEVKTRSTLEEAAYSLSPFQKKRIERALHYYVAGKINQANIRFDVVLLAPWMWPRHIQGAWRID